MVDAGWYQDPKDPGQVRWWDGNGWTHNTQPMPGAVTPEPAQPAAPETPTVADPWAAASQQPEQQWGQQPAAPEQQWGQQPAAPEQQQWGQQPVAPEQQWGQQPVAPEQQQWGQQPAAPEQQQWGQQPAAPEQQWGQQPAAPEQQWGQQPAAPEQQWGQQPAQPEQQQWGQQPAQPEQQQWGQAPGGWQQQPGAPGWGSNVPPAPVPGGLAPGSPMGQTNVFPTAETVDPITGMPVGTGSGDSGGGSSPKRLAALVVGALLVGLLIIGLLWFFLFRGSGSDSGASGDNGQVNVTATFSGTVDPACSDLGAALTADGLTDTVAQRLNDVAIAKDLEENQAYFDQLSKDIKPIMDQYQNACVAAVSAGNAPEFYRTFVETFNTSVSDGAQVATSALGAGGQVPAADADRLRAESSKLSAAGQAVMAITGTPTPSASPSPVTTPTLQSSPAATASPSA